MSNVINAKKIEYRTERNTRMASYKGRYNCEIFINGKFAGDAQGDTAGEATHLAKIKFQGWVKKGAVIDASTK